MAEKEGSGLEPAAGEPRRGRRRIPVIVQLLIAFGVVLGLAFARLLVCIWITLENGAARSDFDSAAWKRDWTCSCTPIRMQMAESLLATHDLRGSTREQVLELLGDPDRNPYVARFEPPGTFIYHLAPHPLIDDYWLVIGFDESGLVREAAVKMD